MIAQRPRADNLAASVGGYGTDVASQRADALDLLAIEHVQSLVADGRIPIAADIGCGYGGQAARLAKAGARVMAVDSYDYSAEVAASMARENIFGGFHFLRARAEDSPPIGPFDVIVCQRMLHYVRKQVAGRLVSWLASLSAPGARLYLSASGMDSELGDGYQGRETPIEERFAPLATAMAEKHAIRAPVCLYRLSELMELAQDSGWTVELAFVSTFGNNKVVATRTGAAAR